MTALVPLAQKILGTFRPQPPQLRTKWRHILTNARHRSDIKEESASYPLTRYRHPVLLAPSAGIDHHRRHHRHEHRHHHHRQVASSSHRCLEMQVRPVPTAFFPANHCSLVLVLIYVPRNLRTLLRATCVASPRHIGCAISNQLHLRTCCLAHEDRAWGAGEQLHVILWTDHRAILPGDTGIYETSKY